jgi:hypothetical protein
MQTPCGSGKPTLTGPQVPTMPGLEQEVHSPRQASLQHTPSAQKPVAHSESAVQGATRLWHAPPAHVPVVQSLSCAQVVVHIRDVSSQA